MAQKNINTHIPTNDFFSTHDHKAIQKIVRENHDRPIIQWIKKIRKLGKGQQNVTFQARLQNPGSTTYYDVAIKTLHKYTLEDKQEIAIERVIHRHLNQLWNHGRNFVYYYEAWM